MARATPPTGLPVLQRFPSSTHASTTTPAETARCMRCFSSRAAVGLPLISGGSAPASNVSEACSVFTLVLACMVAEPLYAALLPECFNLHRYLRKPLWLLPAGNNSCWAGIRTPQGKRALPRRTRNCNSATEVATGKLQRLRRLRHQRKKQLNGEKAFKTSSGSTSCVLSWKIFPERWARRRSTDWRKLRNPLGLKIGNCTLIRRVSEGPKISGRNRYWVQPLAGRWYVCSQWWQKEHRHNAQKLSEWVRSLIADTEDSRAKERLLDILNRLSVHGE